MRSNFFLRGLSSSVDTTLELAARGCEFKSLQSQCLYKLSVLEILVDKDLTDCLIETHTKLKELILAVMIDIVLYRV